MTDLMQYKGYFGSMHLDQENFVLYGKLEFIRALVTYEASSAKQLRSEFEKSVDEYLELCKQENIEPEIPLKGSLNVRLGKELHKRAALMAAQRNTTINAIIKHALEKYVVGRREAS